jgi:hypothetical protein
VEKNEIKSTLAAIAENAAPDADIDLWPGLKDRLISSGWKLNKGEIQMKQRFAQKLYFRWVALAGLAFVMAFAVLLSTSQGRAWAQEVILRFFTRAESDTLPVQPFQLTPIPETTTPDPGFIFNQAIVEAGQKAGFTALVPTSLPEILSFEGASYEPEHKIVRIFYRYTQDAGPNTDGLVLREERFQTKDDCELCGVVGASAEVETVQIGDVPGEYVEGVWQLTDNGPIWESDPYAKTLRFQKNGMAFELFYMGLTINKEDLIAIAESLK